MRSVRIHLNGGPQHGRACTAPTDHAGLPIPRVTISAELLDDQVPAATQPPLLIYERDSRRADGTWDYHYVGSEGRFDDV